MEPSASATIAHGHFDSSGMFKQEESVTPAWPEATARPLWERRSFQLFLLAVAALVSDYGRNAVGPLQETLRYALGLSDNQVALLQGTALALPQVVAAVPLGLLVDRSRRGRLLWVFAVVNLLGSILTAMASSFTVLFGARCLIGLAVTATGPAAYSLIGDLYPAAQRGRATMVYNVGACAGMSAVFAIGGVLATDAAPGVAGWRSAMLWLTSPLVIAVLLMLGMREPTRAGRIVENPSMRQAWAELWSYRTLFGLLMTGWVMIQIGDIAAVVWTAPSMSRGMGLSPARVGEVVGTALFLSGVLGPVGGGLLADWSQRTGGPGRTMAMLVWLALLSILVSAFPVCTDANVVRILLLLFIMIGTAISTVSLTLTIIVIPNELRGLCVALYTVTGAIGMGVAPLAVSLLSSELGGPAMIGKALTVVGAITAVLAAGAFALGKRYLNGHVVA